MTRYSILLHLNKQSIYGAESMACFIRDCVVLLIEGGENMLKKARIVYALMFCGIFLTEIGIALFVKDKFVRPYVGDVLVAVLICSFFRIWIPQKAAALPVYVFLFAVAVEIGQYFDMVKLLGLENNRLLSVLLGRTFSFADILCYAIGCALSFLIDRMIRRFLQAS